MTTAAARLKALPVVPDATPAALKAMLCWVVWRYVPEVDPKTGKSTGTSPAQRPDGRAGQQYEPGNLEPTGDGPRRPSEFPCPWWVDDKENAIAGEPP
jgi:hypothetical protein